MTTVVAKVDIDASAGEIAAMLLDPEAAPLWTAGLRKLEVVEGVIGEPGCVGRALYEEGTRSFVLVDRLLAVTPNRRYLSEVSGGGLSARVETTLAEGDRTTRVTVRWSGKGTNPVTLMSLPFLRRRIARRAATDLESLKRLLETPHPASDA